jgi:hypothetical protein
MMPTGPKGQKRPRDPNQLGKLIVDICFLAVGKAHKVKLSINSDKRSLMVSTSQFEGPDSILLRDGSLRPIRSAMSLRRRPPWSAATYKKRSENFKLRHYRPLLTAARRAKSGL